MTNNQITITNEKDNDQFTNKADQTKGQTGLQGKKLTLCGICIFTWLLEFDYWLLSFILTSFTCHDITAHYDEHADEQLVVVAETLGVRP